MSHPEARAGRSVIRAVGAVVLLLPLCLGACGDPPAPTGPIERLELTLDAEGGFAMATVRGGQRSEIAAGALLQGPGEEAEAALRQLTAALSIATDDPRLRDEDTASALRVYVTADPAAPWLAAQWTLMACAHPAVRVWRVSMRTDPEAEYVVADLPRDSSFDDELIRTEANEDVPGPGSDRPPLRKVKVKLFRKRWRDGEAAFTRIRVGNRDTGRTFDLPSAAASDTTRADRVWSELTTLLRRAHDPERAQIGEVHTPPPDGGRVPAGDVIRVARILRKIGYPRITFDGAPPPLLSGR